MTETDPRKSKEYIADYYQNLYKAREGTSEYEDCTQHIKDTVAEIENSNLEPEPEFTTEEMKEAIKTDR